MVHKNTDRKGRFGNDVVDRRPVFWGSREETEELESQLASIGQEINARHLPYRAWDQNSNTAVGTRLEEAAGGRDVPPAKSRRDCGRVPERSVARATTAQPTYDNCNR